MALIRKMYDEDRKAIEDYFSFIRKSNKAFDEFFSDLSDLGRCILLGGSIRDLTIRNKKPRDLDIIIDAKVKDGEIDNVLLGYNYKKNRFGGYKLNLSDLEIDLWTVRNNWAFKENIITPDVNNIKYSTFYDFDAILYDLSNNKLDSELFNRSIEHGMIDITLGEEFIKENPTHEINILRLFVLQKEWGLNFSRIVEEYISFFLRHWLQEGMDIKRKLVEAERKHYRTYDKLDCDEIKSKLNRYVVVN